MWKSFAIALISIFSFICHAQQNSSPTKTSDPKAGTAQSQKSPDNLRDSARELLGAATVEAAGFQGPMRAYVLLRLARGYVSLDKAKAGALLDDAYISTRTIDDPYSSRRRLQSQIMEAMLDASPQRVIELLPDIDHDSRADTLYALLAYYGNNDQPEKAAEVVGAIAKEREVPYEAFSELIQTLPANKAADVFATALTSYREHKHNSVVINGSRGVVNDLSSLVTCCWRKLPPAQVRAAINELLSQADPSTNTDLHDWRFLVASSKGAVSLGSAYELRLFQLIPALNELDPPRAERLLEGHQDIQLMLKKYPDGMRSLIPDPLPGQPPRPPVSMMLSADAPKERQDKVLDMLSRTAQAGSLADQSASDPQKALAQALAIDDPARRSATLMRIAMKNAKNDPAIAHKALDEAVRAAAKRPGGEDWNLLSSVAATYAQTGNTDDAKKTIQHVMEIARAAFETDTDPNDTNRAVKPFWPSTQAYVAAVRAAGAVSPAYVKSVANMIPDLEIKAAAEAVTAASWLGDPAVPVIVMRFQRKGSYTMMNYSLREW